MKGPLDLFTSIRIHGLAHDANGESAPLALDRSISFPSPTWTCGYPGEPFLQNLASRDLPIDGYTLEARISPQRSRVIPAADSPLGYGLTSFVYPLDVIDIYPSNVPSGKWSAFPKDPILKSLPKLCIKMAQPTHSRSLAREAWFYEQFDKASLTGIAVPRCYGLFHGGPYNRCPPHLPSTTNGTNISTSDNTTFGCLELDLTTYDGFVNEHFATNPRGAANLPEETDSYICVDDDRLSSASSPWFSFRETESTISPTVVLLEELPGADLDDVDIEKEL
jgi:hypothetical protein